MNWLNNQLKRVLSIGRLTGEPKDQNAGKVLAPASVQRTQLGLREVDLPRGVVILRSGEARAFLKVAGFTAHQRSQQEARAWLQGYARALNTLPGNAVLIARSFPGGLGEHINKQRAQTAALARKAPGSALARLAADQLAHARQLEASGQVRQTDCYLAVHSPKGDVTRLLAAAEACRRHLHAAGVRAELVKDGALASALADGWHPERGATENVVQHFGWDVRGDTYLATLNYAPGNARVTEPRYTDDTPAPKASIKPKAATLPATNGKALKG
jgi:hypothetical protein